MASPAPTDEDLAARAGRGDRAAFAELVDRYGVRLVRFLQTSCGLSDDDAEDVAQDVWLKAYRKLPTWNADSFRGWLFTIARNAAIDFGQKRTRRPAVSLDDTDPPAADPPADHAAEYRDEVAKLHDCLGRLEQQKPEFHAVVVGYTAGLTYEQLAAEGDTKLDTIKSRLNRARAALKKCMGTDDA